MGTFTPTVPSLREDCQTVTKEWVRGSSPRQRLDIPRHVCPYSCYFRADVLLHSFTEFPMGFETESGCSGLIFKSHLYFSVVLFILFLFYSLENGREKCLNPELAMLNAANIPQDAIWVM